MWPSEYLAEFIKMYENEPCLWQVSSNDYHDRVKREAGYAKLVNKMKEVHPNASKDDVIKKINNFRSSFRKEIKKIKESMKSGASADAVYKPKLWYFSQLSFLTDQDIPRTSRSNMDTDSDDDCAGAETEPHGQSGDDIVLQRENGGEGVSHQPLTNTSTPPSPSANLPKKANKKALAKRGQQTAPPAELITDVLVQVNDHFKRPRTEEDRFDVTGKTFAIKLRGLSRQQMLLAEKLMNDTLFLAEQGILTLSHRLVSEETLHRSTTSFTTATTPTSYHSQSHSSTPSPTSGVLLHNHNKPDLHYGNPPNEIIAPYCGPSRDNNNAVASYFENFEGV